MKFNNISFGKKIAILLTAPILGLLLVSLSTIYTNVQTFKEMSELAQLTKLSTVYSELVHELQKERGATAGYLGSKGTKFVSKLPEQRKLTDGKIKKRNTFLTNNTFAQTQITALNLQLKEKLSQLSTIRQQVDQQSIKAAKAIGFYTDLNKHITSIRAHS